ncbi:scavenger receptor cysteine-rich protein-like protein [Leptotrombidium deliense]|uniref:Scavenger receptor cysteine-rich protein-like protein n=1 Tax=Leptotrombidium deliense TaxID=299467 RepID=A0A443S887_9ACAR|nr:scavenger receptor cysteine-rich protein-like protein [Leptotrombidium deliense]
MLCKTQNNNETTLISLQNNLYEVRGVESQSDCGENEEYTNCGSACADTCGNYLNKNRMCTYQCVPGCQCTNGLVRHPNGNCVDPRECPVKSGVLSKFRRLETEIGCKENEEYTHCGTACPDTCQNYKNKHRICTYECVIGCKCKDGYVRNSNGKCLHPNQCSIKSQLLATLRAIFGTSKSCKQNEKYTECGSACPDTCDNYQDKGRICTSQCVSGCECNDGYVRNSDGECVHPDECFVKSQIPTAFRTIGLQGEINCKQNEIYTECGSACPDTCDNYNNKRLCYWLPMRERLCQKLECVRDVESQSDCRESEEYTNCGSACADTCDNYLNKNRIYTYQCVSGCQCTSGLVRHPNGKCVDSDECP